MAKISCEPVIMLRPTQTTTLDGLRELAKACAFDTRIMTSCPPDSDKILCAVDFGESHLEFADIRSGDGIKIEYDDITIVGIIEWQAWNSFVILSAHKAAVDECWKGLE